MNNQLLWFLGLAIIALTQALVLVLKLNQRRINKKPRDPENPSHGERLATLEEAVETIKERLEKIEEKLP